MKSRKAFSKALVPVCAFALFGQSVQSVANAQESDARLKASRKSTKPSTFVAGDIGTGLGVFQDIQVPVNEDAGLRADGTIAQTENANHSGFPLWAGLGVVNYRERLSLEGGFDVLQMRATTGPAETQRSSYVRLQGGAGAKYAVPVMDGSLAVGMRVMARRSAWNNVSNGHFLESTIIRGSLGWVDDSRTFEVYGAMAPVARFGYDEGGGFGFGGRPFDQGTASLTEFGLLAGFHLRERVWLDLGLEQEAAHVTISDVVKDYAGYGLVVTPTAERGRAYDLATTVARIGVRKEL